MHISEVKDKTAHGLHKVGSQFPIDSYHQRIHSAAGALIADGFGDFKYNTQVSSGKTYWESPDGRVISVETNGEIYF